MLTWKLGADVTIKRNMFREIEKRFKAFGACVLWRCCALAGITGRADH